jgi:hypothetical protein
MYASYFHIVILYFKMPLETILYTGAFCVCGRRFLRAETVLDDEIGNHCCSNGECAAATKIVFACRSNCIETRSPLSDNVLI